MSCQARKSKPRRIAEELWMREINQISAQISDAAMKVHSALGSGLLESASEDCLLHEGTLRVPPRPQR